MHRKDDAIVPENAVVVPTHLSDTPSSVSTRRPIWTTTHPRGRGRIATDSRTQERVRRGSWALQAPQGAYAGIEAWSGRGHWFATLAAVLATGAGDELRRAARVAPDTLLRVAEADSAVADRRTGRGVTTSHESVAGALGMSAKTVQRARDLMIALGFAAVLVEGRYLTNEERQEARLMHGGDQRRAASLRALTLPRDRPAVENVHLPRREVLKPSTHVLENSPTRASARVEPAARARLRKMKRTTGRHRSAHATAWPIDLQRFAGHLVQRLPWLAEGVHIGSVCRVIAVTGVDVERWSADDLMVLFEAVNVARGWAALSRGHVRRPLGFLAAQVRLAIAHAESVGFVSEAERAAARRIERVEREVRRRRDLEAERAKMAAADHEEIRRIIAASNAEIAARRRAARRGGPRP